MRPGQAGKDPGQAGKDPGQAGKDPGQAGQRVPSGTAGAELGSGCRTEQRAPNWAADA